LSASSPTANDQRFAAIPRLPRDEGGPVFAEPWQAQAFALAVKLSEQGHFTWKEWAATLAEELDAAARRGEPDDGSRYYEHWLAALERLVTAKGLANPTALSARKDAWAEAYRTTPHGSPVELRRTHPRPDGRWLLLGLALAIAGYWLTRRLGAVPVADWTAWAFGAASHRDLVNPQVGFLASAGLGSLLGMRHALEPDHLVAVSTLMTGERTSAQAAWLGACWGLGHTLTLLAAGAVLVMLRADMPETAAVAFEFGVVALLIGFGARAIYQGALWQPPRPTHTHGKSGTAAQPHSGRRMLARPLLVGAVHGLAGSGALTALVLATLPSTATRLGYLALFGLGSILGMAALSGVVGWQIARLGSHRAVARMVTVAIGCVSTVLGVAWGYPLIDRWW
jgi:nitrile hydratase accessory protein